jgi:hypothetical protein
MAGPQRETLSISALQDYFLCHDAAMVVAAVVAIFVCLGVVVPAFWQKRQCIGGCS